MAFKILQWNARSAISNMESLYREIISNHISVACICESWFPPTRRIHFKGYSVLRNDRDDGKGGAAMLIRDTVRFKKLDINIRTTDYQAVAAEISSSRGVFTIVTIYKPSSCKIRKLSLGQIIDQIQTPFLICADFNAHHTLWGCEIDDADGKELLTLLETLNLVLLNDGSPTMVPKPNTRPSAVDLTLCSVDFNYVTEWMVKRDPLGSDHLPLEITINLPNSSINTTEIIYPNSRWKIQEADWTKYTATVQAHFQSFNNLLGPKDAYQQLISIIVDAATTSIPRKKEVIFLKQRPPVWWTPECSRAIAQRKLAYNNFRKQQNVENFIAYRKIAARVRRRLKECKKSSWKNFCESLNNNISIADVWKKLTFFKNKNATTCQPLNDAWLEDFLNLISPASAAEQPYRPSEQSDYRHPLLVPFTYAELKKGIKNAANSAPGKDGIHYQMIENLPDIAIRKLLQIFNQIWMNDTLIEDWTTQIVVPILKPDKDKEKATSYRPISLSSCIGKTLERLVKNRLEWWLESNQILSSSQYGFRKGKGTIDNLNILTADIYDAATRRENVTAVFLDVAGAYDNVNIPLLLQKLETIGIPTRMIYGISTFFAERSIWVRFQNKLIGPRRLTTGIPQGSILSPILFAVYTNDLERMIPSPVKILQYADDICLYVSASGLDQAVYELSKAMGIVDQTLHSYGLHISPEKSVIVPFTNEAIPSCLNSVRLSGYKIPLKSQARFLGVLFDSRLSWVPHIRTVVSTCEKALNLIRSVSRVWWGAHPNVLLTLYRALIRSRIDYGCTVYHNAANKNLALLDKLQYKGLRICLGAMTSSPTNALLVEASEMPLHIRRTMLCDRYILQRMSNTNHPLIKKCETLCRTGDSRNMGKKQFYIYTRYEVWKHIQNKIHRTTALPMFLYDYHSSYLSIPVTYIDSSSKEKGYGQFSLSSYLAEKWAGYTQIYADGSKMEMKNHTGCAFLCPNNSEERKFQLPGDASIFIAETIAIIEAIKYVRSLKVPKAVIITDAQSVLKSISCRNWNKRTNKYTLDLVEHYHQAKKTGQIIEFVWIKSHSGVLYNDKADKLAKEAISSGIPLDIKIPYTDYFQKIRQQAILLWQEEWNESQKTRGRNYASIQTLIPRQPWFAKSKYSRKIIVSIIRMRLNHGSFPAHLHKIGLLETPYCQCDGATVGDVNHILFQCRRYEEGRDKFLKDLLRLGHCQPLCTTSVLGDTTRRAYDVIARFISREDIKI